MAREKNGLQVIADDVLRRIKRNRLRVSSGGYLLKDYATEFSFHPDDNAQEYLSCLEDGCVVCGWGAFFLSYLRIHDNFKMKKLMETVVDFVGQGGPFDAKLHKKRRRIMEQVFDGITSREQLHLIEHAFEAGPDGARYGLPATEPIDGVSKKLTFNELRAAHKFGEQHSTPTERLVAICKNIKRHGFFKP